MSAVTDATAKTAAPKPVRYVEYLDAALRPVVPASLAKPWVAEESLWPLRSRVQMVPKADAAGLRRRAGALVDWTLLLLRREVLPEGDLLEHVYVDPMDRLELVGSSPSGKVRVDEELSVAIIRRRPQALEGPRAGSIRQEMRAALAIPLGDVDRKPIAAKKMVDHGELERNAIYAEFEPPGASGFLGGKFDLLHVYGNGKILLFALRPLGYSERAELPPGAIGAGRVAGRVGGGAEMGGGAGTGIVPGGAAGAGGAAGGARAAGAAGAAGGAGGAARTGGAGGAGGAGAGGASRGGPVTEGIAGTPGAPGASGENAALIEAAGPRDSDGKPLFGWAGSAPEDVSPEAKNDIPPEYRYQRKDAS